MRVLIFSNENNGKFKSIVSFLEKQSLGKVDLFTDIDEAEYCVDIRTYDLILMEYNEDIRKRYMSFLKIAKNKHIKPNIIIFGEELSDAGKEVFDLYEVSEFCFHKENLFKNLEIKIKEHLIFTIEESNLIIDIKEKKVWYRKENEELVEVFFKKKIDFYVFVYFMRHYRETININSILDATCSEPELTKDSIIEASISSIRKTFKTILGINPIRAFKKVGYEFSVIG